MTRFAVVCMLMVALPVLAADPPKSEDVKATAKKLAQAMGDATVKGDMTIVLDHTYEPALKPLGGRKEAEAKVKDLAKEIESLGIKMKSYKVDDPGELYTEGDNTFVVLTTTLELSTPDGKIKVPSYLLGISTDAGKTWKFVDGAGLKDKKSRDSVLPKMPAKLELPEPKPPEVTKDK